MSTNPFRPSIEKFNAMSAVSDQFLYQMDYQDHSDQWFDFENSFDFTTAYLDSDSTSLKSISPEDYNLVCDSEEVSLQSQSGFSSQPSFADITSYNLQIDDLLESTVDINAPDLGRNYLFDHGIFSPKVGPSGPEVNDVFPYCQQEYGPAFFDPSDIRQMVEARAAADPRCVSRKEKLKDASIAIHLQRLMDASAADIDFSSSDSNTSFSSPCWSDFVRDSFSPQPTPKGSSATPSPSSDSPESSTLSLYSGTEPLAGGMEMVLDLNMNATTNLPRKQKPRSQAQKENYIKVRKVGACEKHRKQHKRCNCLDKSATQIRSTAIASTLGQLPRTASQQIKSFKQVSSVQRPQTLSVERTVDLQTTTTANRNTCPTPGCNYSSSAVPSLQTHHAKHIHRSVNDSPTDGRVEQSRLQSRHRLRIAQPWISSPQQSASVSAAVQLQTTQNVLPPNSVASTNRTTAVVYCDPSSVSPTVYHGTSQAARQASRTSVKPQQTTQERLPLVASVALVNRSSSLQSPVLPGRYANVLSLIESASAVVQTTAVAFSSFWRTSVSVTSWASGLFGRFAVSSCKQFLCAKKGLGLY